MMFSAEDFFSKFEQICRKLRIFFIFAKKTLKKNFVFCAVQDSQPEANLIIYSWRNLELIHHCDTVYLNSSNKKPIEFSTFGSPAHLNVVLLLKYRSFSKVFLVRWMWCSWNIQNFLLYWTSWILKRIFQKTLSLFARHPAIFLEKQSKSVMEICVPRKRLISEPFHAFFQPGDLISLNKTFRLVSTGRIPTRWKSF